MKDKISNHFNELSIVLIMVAATVLRFWKYTSIPYTYDEFSALFRTRYDNFSDLIAFGVKPDGHPAAVQVFMYYWVKYFGDSPASVKLPFVLMGIASVYLVYLIGKNWFNKTVGLLTAAVVSTLQITVMYSQIARPYISGLFFSLLMVYAVINLTQKKNKAFYPNALLFIVSFSLCTYNHYFSFLFAVVVGLTIFFLARRKDYLKFAIFAAVIFALYIPYLPIFFHQLKLGGIGGPEGWLAPPRLTFVSDFIYYVFNYSLPFVGVVLAIAVGAFFSGRFKKIPLKKYLVLSAWFLLPLAIGFAYSVFVNPVIQFSTLIFSFTYLIFIAFAHIEALKPRTNFMLVVLILAIGCHSLIYNRAYYHYFYHSPYQSVLHEIQEFNASHPKGISFLQSHRKITDYYEETESIKAEYIWIDDTTSLKTITKLVQDAAKEKTHVFLGCMHNLHPAIIPIIQTRFPVMEVQNNYWGGTSYQFSKGADNREIIGHTSFSLPKPHGWSWNENQTEVDTALQNGLYLFTSNDEWGPTFTAPLDTLIKAKTNFIDLEITGYFPHQNTDVSPFTSEALLVTTLESDDRTLYWSAQPFNDFIWNSEDSTFTVISSVKLSDINLNHRDIQFKTFIWNQGRETFGLYRFTLYLRDGNPVIYGIINPL